MNARSRWLAVVAVVTLLAACRSARRGEPLAGAMDLSDPAVARGQEVFARYCHACHPGGEAGLGPGLNDKPLPVFLMKFQVRHGLGAMPGFPEEAFGDRHLDDLMAYVVARRHHGG